MAKDWFLFLDENYYLETKSHSFPGHLSIASERQ